MFVEAANNGIELALPIFGLRPPKPAERAKLDAALLNYLEFQQTSFEEAPLAYVLVTYLSVAFAIAVDKAREVKRESEKRAMVTIDVKNDDED